MNLPCNLKTVISVFQSRTEEGVNTAPSVFNIRSVAFSSSRAVWQPSVSQRAFSKIKTIMIPYVWDTMKRALSSSRSPCSPTKAAAKTEWDGWGLVWTPWCHLLFLWCNKSALSCGGGPHVTCLAQTSSSRLCRLNKKAQHTSQRLKIDKLGQWCLMAAPLLDQSNTCKTSTMGQWSVCRSVVSIWWSLSTPILSSWSENPNLFHKN